MVVMDGPGDLPGFDALTEGDQNEGEIDIVANWPRKQIVNKGEIWRFPNYGFITRSLARSGQKRLQGADPHKTEDIASHHGWQGLGEARLPPSLSLCSRS